jgi:ADP-L-glycero-D-manno-heptose 6-epimerase
MKSVIVTGGAGFIGSTFVKKLNQEGVDDILIVDDLGTSDKWKNLLGLRYTDYLHKDVFLRKINSGTLDFKARAVVHMGACSRTSMLDMNYLMENNYRYTRVLAEWTVAKGIRFIYASSAATYGDGEHGFSDRLDLDILRPKNGYAYSKHFFDSYAHHSGLSGQIVGLKFFNVFGPNEYHKKDMVSMVYRAFRQIQQNGEVELFKSYRDGFADGEQKRDFVYSKDCADVMWWFLTNENINGLFNLGTGEARSWNELVRAVFWAMERPPRIAYIPMPELLRPNYQYFTQADMQQLNHVGCPLNFRSLEEAVHDYVTNDLTKRYSHYSSFSGDSENAQFCLS